MKVPPGTHTITGDCPACGEPIELRLSLALYRATGPAGHRFTRVRLSALGQPHGCTDRSTYPLFDAESERR